jgi:hypothetical protein
MDNARGGASALKCAVEECGNDRDYSDRNQQFDERET